MGNQELYDSQEMKEIQNFLVDSYIDVMNENPSARRRDPSEAVSPEVKRLRTKIRRQLKDKLSEEDLDELIEAIEGPFAKDFETVKQDKLRELAQVTKTKVPEKSGKEKREFSRLLAGHLITQFCQKKPVPDKAGKILITTATLGAVLVALGISAVFAPVAIWILTQARDVGIPAFCKAATEYLK